MVNYKIGNLLDAEVDAIAHCCNCYNSMKSGIAPKIKNRWPEVYTADCETKRADRSKLGTFSKAVVEGGDLTVYNLYAQFGFWLRGTGGRDLDYNALFDALDKMADDVIENGGKSVGLPLIGCGLAGGKWSVVEAMIEETLVAKGLEVYVYKLN